ncbi:MAG: hypothetical protein JNK84_00530 [Phreatobacter sp.]|uniref:hypothetical protein n=1 Tax=Phreatobacter sp. TaxID=1966341 RepID=UPI001A441581|nr:hypothetical protein [Phreatobacter sp.]MBL8567546.1 hypothetical protein [Phreatobacter sp.]
MSDTKTDRLPGNPRPWTRRETLAVAAVILAFWGVTVAAYSLEAVTIPWDAKSQFYNFFRFVGRALAQGEPPLWNPYHFSGFPSVADPQSLLFSPTFLIAAWLAPKASMGSFDAIALAHLAGAGVATAALCARRGFAPQAAVLAAAIVFFGGPAMGRLQHIGLVVSYAWLPVCLLFLELALDRRSWRWSLAFGCAAAVMALGRDQIAFLNCLVLVAFALTHAATHRPLAGWLRMRGPYILLMGIVGAAILAVPLLLTLQFAAFSNRPVVAFQTAAYGSLDPFNLIGLFAADIFGGLQRTDLYFGPGTPHWPNFDWTDRSVNFLHVGMVATLLTAGIGLAGGAAFRPGLRFFAGLGAASLVYALGAHTPLFRFAFELIPGVSLYRRPADATFILILAIAMIAGGSLDAAMRERVRVNRIALATFAALAAVGTGFALARAPSPAHLAVALAALGSGAAVCILALWLLRQLRAPERVALAATALAALAIAELGFHNVTTPINAEAKAVYAVFRDEPSPDRAALSILLAASNGDHAAGRRPRVEILGPENGWQNAGMTYGIEATLGYNPLRFALYERATGAAETAHEPRLRPFPQTFRGYRSLLARLLGIELVMFDKPLGEMPASLPRPRLETLMQGPPYWIYRLPRAAPRALLAARYRAIDVEAILSAGEIPAFDIESEVLISRSDPVEAVPPATDDPGRPTPGRVAIADYRLNSVRLVAETEVASILVLHDLDYPGWEVTVNGQRRPLLRANVLFRGVELTPGRHEIVFRFRPFSAENLWAALATVRGKR